MIDTLDDLRSESPEAIYNWLISADVDENDFEVLEWLGLAESADTKMQLYAFAGNLEKSLLWGQIVIFVYEHLAQRDDKASFDTDAMRQRAFLISKFGEQKEHPILNVSILLDWFWQTVTISPEEAVEKSKRIKHFIFQENNRSKENIAELKKLRMLRQKVYIFRMLKEAKIPLNDEKILNWIDSYTSLP